MDRGRWYRSITNTYTMFLGRDAFYNALSFALLTSRAQESGEGGGISHALRSAICDGASSAGRLLSIRKRGNLCEALRSRVCQVDLSSP